MWGAGVGTLEGSLPVGSSTDVGTADPSSVGDRVVAGGGRGGDEEVW